MNNTHHDEIILSKLEQWGYSFLGVTLGVCSVLLVPLIFKCFSPKHLKTKLVWFGLFGSGIIVSLIINHNLIEIIEIIGFNWKVGSVFLAGLFTNKVFLYGFTTEDHCCELEEPCVEDCCDNQQSINMPECCSSNIEANVNNKVDPLEKENIVNIHSAKHWSIPIIIGDAFCNFADGMIISSAFTLCGISAGFITTLAVIIHELAHEIGDFSIMINTGLEFNKAVLYNLLCAFTSYIGWLLVNSLSYLDDAKTITTYFLTFGSGVLLSLSMTIIPKYIKHKKLNIQRLRLFVLFLSFVIGSVLFNIIPHCETGHDHIEHENHHL
jgi:zinc transporter ZupT